MLCVLIGLGFLVNVWSASSCQPCPSARACGEQQACMSVWTGCRRRPPPRGGGVAPTLRRAPTSPVVTRDPGVAGGTRGPAGLGAPPARGGGHPGASRRPARPARRAAAIQGELAGWLAGWRVGEGRRWLVGGPGQASRCRSVLHSATASNTLQTATWMAAGKWHHPCAPASVARRVTLGPWCLLCDTPAPSAALLRRHTRRPLPASRRPSNRRLPSPASSSRPPAVCPPGSTRYPAPPRWPLPPPSLFSEPPAPAAGAGRLPHLPQQLPGSCGRHAGVRAPPGGRVP